MKKKQINKKKKNSVHLLMKFLDMQAVRSMKVNQSMLTNCAGPNVAAIMHSKRPIAPAIDKNQSFLVNNNLSNSNQMQQIMQNDGKYKRKYNYSGVPYSNQQTASVVRRNARERNRVKQVNNGFANLRQHIPSKVITQLTNGGRGANKKLSKVDTLKLAVEYIRSLQSLLDESEKGVGGSGSAKLGNKSLDSSYYSSSGGRSTNSPVSPAPSFMSESSTSGYSNHHHHHRSAGKFKLEPFDQYDQSSDTSSSPYSPNETTFVENPFTACNTNATVATATANQHHPNQPPFKHESYEEYETINPEDEELLDTITWWQQQ